jgi:putative addiction module antidote
MLELKVRRIGNSLGVVLPKEAVSRLHADEGDRLFLIEGPNGVCQLTPYDPAFERKMKKAGDIINRYRNTLHSLAKCCAVTLGSFAPEGGGCAGATCHSSLGTTLGASGSPSYAGVIIWMPYSLKTSRIFACMRGWS